MANGGFVRPDDLIFAFLKTSGNSRDMAVNGSSTPVPFFYSSPDRKWVLSRANITVLDAGPITATTFGGDTALTNGLGFEIRGENGALLKSFTGGMPITRNADWGTLAGVDWSQSIGAGLDAVTVRWSMFKSGKEVLMFPGETFQCEVRDDLSSLTEMTIMIQGYFV